MNCLMREFQMSSSLRESELEALMDRPDPEDAQGMGETNLLGIFDGYRECGFRMGHLSPRQVNPLQAGWYNSQSQIM